MEKYKILIISDPKGPDYIEDLAVATSFKRDGHIVKVFGIGYETKYDEKFDILLRRNTWVENKPQTDLYDFRNGNLMERLMYRKVPGINIIGFQEEDYSYLETLTKKGEPNVIPTITSKKDLEILQQFSDSKQFVLRKKEDYYLNKNSAICVNIDNLSKLFTKDIHLIQADLKFKSEVEFYFVGNKLMYAFEYAPTKYNKLAKERLINISEEDRKVVQRIADLSDLRYGMQRLDFVRLENNELMLMDIRDTSVKMNLYKIDSNMRNEVITEYKKGIYEFLSSDPQTIKCSLYCRSM